MIHWDFILSLKWARFTESMKLSTNTHWISFQARSLKANVPASARPVFLPAVSSYHYWNLYSNKVGLAVCSGFVRKSHGYFCFAIGVRSFTFLGHSSAELITVIALMGTTCLQSKLCRVWAVDIAERSKKKGRRSIFNIWSRASWLWCKHISTEPRQLLQRAAS